MSRYRKCRLATGVISVMKQMLFFEQTTSSIKELNAVIDNFASALIAIRNLRCEVRGILAECPDFTEEMFHVRYHFDKKIRWKNYRTKFEALPFSEQEEAFTWYLLYSTCAVFEGWLAKMKEAGLITSTMIKDLQFPVSAANKMNAHISADTSQIMTSAFYPSYRTNKKYSYQNITALLYCYRTFKEMRNALVHSGKIATQKCVAAYCDYQNNCTTVTLGTKEIPVVHSMSLGAPIVPSFRGVIGFTDIVIRILISYDTELIRTKVAEQYFLNKYRAIPESRNLPSANRGKANRQFLSKIRKCGFSISGCVSDLQKFLTMHGFNC